MEGLNVMVTTFLLPIPWFRAPIVVRYPGDFYDPDKGVVALSGNSLFITRGKPREFTDNDVICIFSVAALLKNEGSANFVFPFKMVTVVHV